MINGVIVSVFVPLACSLLSLAFHCYGNYRQRKTCRGVYMTVSYVTAISAIACFLP